MENAVLEIVLKARDEATAVIEKAGKSLTGLSDNAVKGAGIIAGAATIAGVAIAAVGVYSIKSASDFQSSMTLIQTQAGGSAQEVKKMTAAVLEMAGQTATAPKTLADGLFYVESAGFRGAKALDILRLAAEGAKVGHADLGQTANVLTTIMNSNIKGVSNATDAMGLLNATVGAGKMKMADLVGAMGTGIIPVAQSLGISFKDLGASIATMTNNGVGAEEASTRLKTSLAMMEDPTTKASKALASIGISHRQLADDMRSPGGLGAALADIKAHLNAVEPATTSFVKGTKMSADQVASMTEKVKLAKEQVQILNDTHVKGSLATEKHAHALEAAQAHLSAYESKLGKANSTMVSYAGGALDATQKTQLLLDAFGGGRQGSTMLTLIGHTDQFNDRLKQVTKTGGDFKEAWKKTSEDAGFAFEKLATTLQVLAIKFGNVLLPVVTKIANFLADNLVPAIDKTTKFFEKHKDALALVAAVIGGALTMAVIAFGIAAIPAVIAVGAFVVAFAPFIIAGAVIAGIIALIVLHFKDIQNILGIVGNFFKQVWNDILSLLQQVGKWLVSTFAPFFKFAFDVIKIHLIVINDIFVLTWAAIKFLLDAFGKWLNSTFGSTIKAVFDTIKGWLNDASNVWATIWSFITGILNAFGGWLNSTFAPFFKVAFTFINTALKALSDGWVKTWNGIKSFVIGIAEDIMSVVKNMINSIIGFIDHIIDGANKIGSKIPGYIQIPDIPKFEQGGYVPQTGIALLHEGEFVLSKSMLSGQANVPSQIANKTTNNNNTPVTIYATINEIMDMNLLGQKIAFAVRNSR